MSILTDNIDELDNATCEWEVKIIGADSKIDQWLRQFTPSQNYWTPIDVIITRVEKFILDHLSNKPITEITSNYIRQILEACVKGSYKPGFDFIQPVDNRTTYYGIQRRLTKYSPMVGIYVRPKR